MFSCETDGDPDILKENLQRLPVTLAESVEALEKDPLFKEMIGENLLVAIIGVRKVRCYGCLVYTLDVKLNHAFILEFIDIKDMLILLSA